MSLPRLIHYCWFGPRPIPAQERKCVATWKHFFPSYEIVLWNESNVDLSENEFASQAYAAGKYAFVSDFVRTKVLFELGGIYLDADVEVRRNFEELFQNVEGIVGFETRAKIGTAVMGFVPQSPIMQEFMNYYRRNEFINKKREMNTIANVTILTDILTKKGLTTDGSNQVINGVHVYPREYFYPKKISEAVFRVTDQTVAIHRCSNSWMTDRERRRGNNKLWINIARPVLRRCKSLALNIASEGKIREIEIKIRNILK